MKFFDQLGLDMSKKQYNDTIPLRSSYLGLLGKYTFNFWLFQTAVMLYQEYCLLNKFKCKSDLFHNKK